MSFRVYQSFENSTPFLRGYKELRIPIADANGIPAWPELFPLEKIEQLREIVGARHFSSQMMLEYINEEKTHLDPGALHFYDDEFDSRTAKIVDSLITGMLMYWDPSGGRVKSDGSVCVLIYRDDKNRRAFIHDIRYLSVTDDDLHPLASQYNAVLDFMRAYGTNRIAIEVNGIGNALPEIMREAARKQNRPVVVQKIINHQRKETRILDSIEPLLTTGRLYVLERIKYSPLLSEMLGWSPLGAAQHDDELDAVAGALRVQAIPVRSMSHALKILKARTDFKL
ncbi:MAG: hypothetical protein LBF37_04220 [Rickettsiales bacterium]|jgi:predicted phage terminase large subunit-like protein|nr:hypothetical protein [Rickettsiales bacterium]